MVAWRENTYTPEASPVAIECTLPADLLLEIVARSDVCTLVRCAAVCKLLRQDILCPHFIHRVTRQDGIVPPCILAYLNTPAEPRPPPLSLVHPATPAAASFLDVHLAPFLADDLLSDHYAVTSRGGLVLLHRRHIRKEVPDLCVYNLFTRHRTFLSYPPGINHCDMCVLLTSEDGIGCSFMLFVANFDETSETNIQVHTTTSTCNAWAPAVTIDEGGKDFVVPLWFAMYEDAVVLHGGVMHWLLWDHSDIVAYDVRTTERRTIKVPVHMTNFRRQLYLGSYYSHDGQKLLRLFGVDGFKISVWHQLPYGHWELTAMTIDTEEKLRSLGSHNGPGQPVLVVFRYFGERSNTLLLHVYFRRSSTSTALPIVLDLETEEMCVQRYSTPSPLILEVDLQSRLGAMEIFLSQDTSTS